MAGFALQPALDLAERRAEAKSRRVKLAYVAWLNARTQVVRLEQQRLAYSGALDSRLRRGCSAAVAQAAGTALRRWQADLQAARRALAAARQDWRAALDDWQVERRRAQALALLAHRHALEQRRLEERREQRLHDELSARSVHVRRFSVQGEAAFAQAGEGA